MLLQRNKQTKTQKTLNTKQGKSKGTMKTRTEINKIKNIKIEKNSMKTKAISSKRQCY